MSWHSHILRSILRAIKRQTPAVRRLIRERKFDTVIFLSLFLGCLFWRKWIPHPLLMEEKDSIFPLIPAGVFVTGFVLYQGIRYFLEKRPAPLQTRRDVHNLAKVLFKIETGTTCTRVIRRIRLKSDRSVVTVDSPELIKIMTRMNCHLFTNSVHGQSYEAKLARNQEHAARNPNVIRMLGVREAERERIASLTKAEKTNIPEIQRAPWVGFSHILPISESTYHAYVWPDEEHERIEDITFSADRICPVGKEAYAFLVFTVALDGPLVRRWEVPPFGGTRLLARKNLRRERLVRAEQDLYLMVFDHLRALANLHNPGKRECRILAQSMLGTTAQVLDALGF